MGQLKQRHIDCEEGYCRFDEYDLCIMNYDFVDAGREYHEKSKLAESLGINDIMKDVDALVKEAKQITVDYNPQKLKARFSHESRGITPTSLVCSSTHWRKVETMSDQLGRDLYQAIENAREERVYEKSHASSIADCPRSHWFKRIGLQGTFKPTAAKIIRWDGGHALETAIRPHLQTLFEDFEYNSRFNSLKWDLTGEFDGYSRSDKALIEVKSVHDFAFKYRKKADTRDHLKEEKPYLAHIMQNHCYKLLLDEEEDMPVDKIHFVYISLGGRLCTYTVPINDNILTECKRRLTLIKEAVETQTPPECLCKDENHPLYAGAMKWCNYQQGDKCCDLGLLDGNEGS